MTEDCGVEPGGSTLRDEKDIREAQQRMVVRFTEMDDPLFTYELLIDAGRRLERLLEAEKTDWRKVKGCQSQAWLKLSAPGGAFRMEADSDTLVVCGILEMLTEAFNGASCAAVAAAPVDFLQEAGVMDTFDATRRAGISRIIEDIRAFAAAQ